jgi:hypothetical protein
MSLVAATAREEYYTRRTETACAKVQERSTQLASKDIPIYNSDVLKRV